MEDFKDTSGSLVGEGGIRLGGRRGFALRYGKCVFGFGLFARRGEMGCLDKEFVFRYDGYVERELVFASYMANVCLPLWITSRGNVEWSLFR